MLLIFIEKVAIFQVGVIGSRGRPALLVAALALDLDLGLVKMVLLEILGVPEDQTKSLRLTFHHLTSFMSCFYILNSFCSSIFY